MSDTRCSRALASASSDRTLPWRCFAASAIAPLAAGDPVRAAALAAALAIMSGVLLMVAARFDLGSVADVLSKPVLVGYANAPR